MLAVRSLLKANSNLIKNVAQQRNMSVITVPARTKVSTGEMVVLAAAMVVGWTAVPIWVLCNIRNYRGVN